MSDAQYWVKTIEYAFVDTMSKAGLLNFATAASVQAGEGAQNLIFQSYARLLLVEFRPRMPDPAIDQDRFDNYAMARDLLHESCRHHLVIHGEFDRDQMALNCRPYFDTDSIPLVNIAARNYLEKKPFNKYLLQLLALRKRDLKRGGAIRLDEHASVLAVNGHDKIVAACSLRDYVDEVFPAFLAESPVVGDESGITG